MNSLRSALLASVSLMSMRLAHTYYAEQRQQMIAEEVYDAADRAAVLL